jgi:hypothetical protein
LGFAPAFIQPNPLPRDLERRLGCGEDLHLLGPSGMMARRQEQFARAIDLVFEGFEASEIHAFHETKRGYAQAPLQIG